MSEQRRKREMPEGGCISCVVLAAAFLVVIGAVITALLLWGEL